MSVALYACQFCVFFFFVSLSASPILVYMSLSSSASPRVSLSLISVSLSLTHTQSHLRRPNSIVIDWPGSPSPFQQPHQSKTFFSLFS